MAFYRSPLADTALLIWADIHNQMLAAGFDGLFLVGDRYEEYFYAV